MSDTSDNSELSSRLTSIISVLFFVLIFVLIVGFLGLYTWEIERRQDMSYVELKAEDMNITVEEFRELQRLELQRFDGFLKRAGVDSSDFRKSEDLGRYYVPETSYYLTEGRNGCVYMERDYFSKLESSDRQPFRRNDGSLACPSVEKQ